MAFVQAFSATTGPAIATSGSNVTSGNVLCGVIWWNSTTITLTSIANTRGANLTLLGNPTASTNLGGRAALFYGQFTSGAATCTLTPTFSVSPSTAMMAVHEYSGVDTAQIIDNSGAAWAVQELAGGGSGATPDFYTSGNLTTTTAGCTIAGFVIDPNNNNDMSSGTGYTDRNTTQSTEARYDSEDRVQSSAGAIAVTFSSSNNFRTAIIAGFGLKPTGAAGPVIPVFMNQYRQRRQ